MQKRIKINSIEQPKAFKAMMALETYLAQATISKTLKDLIKIRASQINGCAYCIDMHTKEAIDNGERLQRIFLISAWREASKFFTEEEQTILTITEQITLIHQNGLSDEMYQNALRFFNEDQIAEIIIAIATINAWNRIAISTHEEIED
ncbi:carboxymuconolactone decarboxylase family protein [Flavobacterium panici]|uniref:Carboxymuconolactone decarboxylase family protein n=1 Tax=Flavobacterium panici TaxID=2654843 RepID=A0A9N8J4N7_9FLAO|nr:carboxymuconolactone decarboxylase family protein [Flavobacterium panici]CAC9975449.1 carboxymuconolactone decarboxylase family protein [Flavobacterium panici]